MRATGRQHLIVARSSIHGAGRRVKGNQPEDAERWARSRSFIYRRTLQVPLTCYVDSRLRLWIHLARGFYPAGPCGILYAHARSEGFGGRGSKALRSLVGRLDALFSPVTLSDVQLSPAQRRKRERSRMSRLDHQNDMHLLALRTSCYFAC